MINNEKINYFNILINQYNNKKFIIYLKYKICKLNTLMSNN